MISRIVKTTIAIAIAIYGTAYIPFATWGGAAPAYGQGNAGEFATLPAPDGLIATNYELTPGHIVLQWNEVKAAAFYRVGWAAQDDVLRANTEGGDWLSHFHFAEIPNYGEAHPAYRAALDCERTYAFIVASLPSRFAPVAYWSEWQYLGAPLCKPCPTAPRGPVAEKPDPLVWSHQYEGGELQPGDLPPPLPVAKGGVPPYTYWLHGKRPDGLTIGRAYIDSSGATIDPGQTEPYVPTGSVRNDRRCGYYPQSLWVEDSGGRYKQGIGQSFRWIVPCPPIE